MEPRLERGAGVGMGEAGCRREGAIIKEAEYMGRGWGASDVGGRGEGSTEMDRKMERPKALTSSSVIP